jgi:DNA-binding transcriptional regulator YhcF (GntR family)
MRREVNLTRRLRDYIIGGIHIGQIHSGDQLPSYRELSEEWEVDHRAVARAYKTLEEEGLVEVRGRSGVYLAPQEKIAGEMLPETARWVAEEVLTEAWTRRIKIPELPQFIRRCTSSVKVRAACIESIEDRRYLLCTELHTWFGFDTTPVSAADLGRAVRSSAKGVPVVDMDALPREIRSADVLVTFSFHAQEVRAVAEALQKPYSVATIHPTGMEIIHRHLQHDRLTLICVDPGLGDRLKSVVPKEYADRIHVILTRDKSALSQLDPNREPLLVSAAARAQLRRDLPSILQEAPALSPESAAELSHLLIRMNLEAAQRSKP